MDSNKPTYTSKPTQTIESCRTATMTGCSSSSSSFWRAVLLFVFCVVSVPALQQRLCSGKRGCHGRGSGMAYGSVDETDSRRENDSSGDFAVCKDQVHGLSFDAEPPVHRVSIAYPPIGRTNVDSILCGALMLSTLVCTYLSSGFSAILCCVATLIATIHAATRRM